MREQNLVRRMGGNTAEDILQRAEMLASMSDRERKKFVKDACGRAEKVHLSEDDVDRIMEANGSFPDENGEYE